MSVADTDETTLLFEDVSLGSVQTQLIPANSTIPGRKRYLFHFIHRHLNFRIPEVESLAELACGTRVCADGLPPIVWETPADGILASPYWFVHLPSEDIALAISKHSLLLRCVIDVVAQGATWEELFAAIKALPADFQKYAQEDQSFKFVVSAYGRKIDEAEKIGVIESFEDSTDFKGKIDLTNPMHKWWVIMVGNPATPTMPALPTCFYFGREIVVGDARLKLAKYELKKRRYIGPTSMDAELAFIMCNLGLVRRNSIVMDPNVGTGSMLVAAAAQGAHVLGCDIDARVIKIGKTDAKGEHLNLWTNFRDYGIPAPIGLWRGDMHRPPLRQGLEEIIDAMLCDPPYGVRAGGRKSKSVPDMQVPERATHIPATAPYALGECLRDLLDLAARLLVVGGRLVFWIPTAKEVYKEEELPSHPMLEKVANCEQLLTCRYGRRCITLQKVRRYVKEEAEAHYEALGSPTIALETINDIVYQSRENYEAGGGNGKPTRPRMRNKLV